MPLLQRHLLGAMILPFLDDATRPRPPGFFLSPK